MVIHVLSFPIFFSPEAEGYTTVYTFEKVLIRLSH